MSRHTEDMNNVADWGEALPEAWYHVRVSKAEETVSESSKEPVVKLYLAVQDEPFVGRNIMDFPSLQPHALAKLKAYYKATGKGIIPPDQGGGHDPEALKDGECYVKVDHEIYQGQTRMKVAPWSIKSLMEGRPRK